MKDPKYKVIHMPDCDGTITRTRIDTDLKRAQLIATEYKDDCKKNTIVFSLGFKPRFIHVGDCVLKKIKEIDVIKHYFEHHDYDLYCKQSGPEKWDGGDYIEELVCSTGFHWNYYTRTKVSEIANIFCDETEHYFTDDDVDSFSSTRALALKEINLKYLKENEFVSKRANYYTVSHTDVNFIINKLNKQLKHGISK